MLTLPAVKWVCSRQSIRLYVGPRRDDLEALLCLALKSKLASKLWLQSLHCLWWHWRVKGKTCYWASKVHKYNTGIFHLSIHWHKYLLGFCYGQPCTELGAETWAQEKNWALGKKGEWGAQADSHKWSLRSMQVCFQTQGEIMSSSPLSYLQSIMRKW